MAEGVTSRGADIKVAFPLPRQGIVRTVSEESAPKDALFDGLNTRLRRGELVARPGLTELVSTVLGSRPTGATFFRDASGNRFAVVGGRTTFHRWDGSTFTAITGATPPAGAVTDLFRFTTLRVGSDVHLVAVNGQVAPQRWTGTGNFVTVSGSPPVFLDVTTAFDRIVGVTTQSARWGDAQSISSFPAANEKLFMESPDEVVGIEPLGALNLVVFKEKSLWVGLASGIGTSAFAFRWDFRGWYEGPASPAAKVNINGQIYYMTPQGRVGLFNGTRHEWVADGVWPIIQDDIGANTPDMAQAWAVYDPLNHDIYFTYARAGDNTELTGLLVLSLPRPKHGLPHHAGFPGRWSFGLSAGTVFRQADLLDRVMLLISESGDERALTLEGNTDDGTNFDIEARTWLQPMPGFDVHRMQSIEPFLRRGTGFGTVDLEPIVSDVLDVPGGTLGSFTREDLTVVPVKGIVGMNAVGRYMGLRFSTTSNNTFRYMGALIRARLQNPQPQRRA